MARVQVELDLLQPRLDKLWIGVEHGDGFWQPIEYAAVPSYCQHCSHVGHSATQCKIHHSELQKSQAGTSRPDAPHLWKRKKTHASSAPLLSHVLHHSPIPSVAAVRPAILGDSTTPSLSTSAAVDPHSDKLVTDTTSTTPRRDHVTSSITFKPTSVVPSSTNLPSAPSPAHTLAEPQPLTSLPCPTPIISPVAPSAATPSSSVTLNCSEIATVPPSRIPASILPAIHHAESHQAIYHENLAPPPPLHHHNVDQAVTAPSHSVPDIASHSSPSFPLVPLPPATMVSDRNALLLHAAPSVVVAAHSDDTFAVEFPPLSRTPSNPTRAHHLTEQKRK